MVLYTLSCEKNGPSETPSLDVQSPSNVTETSFQLNWSTSSQNFQSISIDLSLDRKLEVIEEHVTITDATAEHYLFTGKKGATKYFYKISLIVDGKTETVSDLYGVETSYEAEGINLLTSDEMKLTGSLAYLKSNMVKRPGIIMMHELGVWVNPWIDSPLLKRLVSEGYVCLTFFFRGRSYLPGTI